MLNQIVIVGRLVKNPEVKLTENGRKVSSVTLAVPRSYKNVNGTYDTDFIDCTLWSGIAESTSDYCERGDMIGVRGRLQTKIIDKEDGTKRKVTEVVAEKVTFLSTKNNNEEVTLSSEEVELPKKKDKNNQD